MTQQIAARPPCAGIAENPAEGVRSMREVEPGRSIAELAAELNPAPRKNAALVCRLNGEWLSRMTAAEHDRVELLEQLGREDDAIAFEEECCRAMRAWHDVRVENGDVVEFFEMPEGNGLRIVAGVALALVDSTFLHTGYLTTFGLAMAAGGVMDPHLIPKEPTSCPC